MSEGAQTPMSPRLTVEQLESMKTHELADLLANVVLLLRRMPNVECHQLAAQFAESVPSSEAHPARPLALTLAELKSYKMDELKKLAHDLDIPFASKIRKDELINKIHSWQSNTHSEQYAIQHI
jgi:hypothetical protein